MILRELVIGYVEEDDDDEEEEEGDGTENDDAPKAKAEGEERDEERRQSAASEGAASNPAEKPPKINKFRIAGQAVKLVAARGAFSSDSLVSRQIITVSLWIAVQQYLMFMKQIVPNEKRC